MAEQVHSITVVCLKEGEHDDLPDNVKVKSIGKEKGEGKRGYLRNFYKHCFQLFKNKDVDVVFVQMIEIFALLIWPLALFFGKPIIWWKAHGNLSWKSKLAAKLVTKIVTSSEGGFPIKTNKKIITGQGVDTDYFKQKEKYNKEVKKIIWVGRISPVKNIETLIKAADILVNQKGHQLTFYIIGSVPLKVQEVYFEGLKKEVENKKLENNVRFIGSVPHQEIVRTYQEADVFINTGQTGSLDKTVLEAMSTGTVVINSNPGFKEIFKDFPFAQFAKKDASILVEHLELVMNMKAEEKQEWGNKLRQIVVSDHNIDNLVNKLLEVFIKVTK